MQKGLASASAEDRIKELEGAVARQQADKAALQAQIDLMKVGGRMPQSEQAFADVQKINSHYKGVSVCARV